MNASCPTCGKRFEGPDGAFARVPLVLNCLCVFCRGCAEEHEKSMNSGITEVACISCSRISTGPLTALLPSLPHIEAAAASSHQAARHLPILSCDVCEDEDATKYCSHCIQRLNCFATAAIHFITSLPGNKATHSCQSKNTSNKVVPAPRAVLLLPHQKKCCQIAKLMKATLAICTALHVAD